MPAIRVIKTTDGRIVIQHAPGESCSDANLPLGKASVAGEALTTHEALEAAGVRDPAQLDIVDGQLVIDTQKPAFSDVVESRRQAAIQKLMQLPGDPNVAEPTRGYLLAILDAAAIGPGALVDPNGRSHRTTAHRPTPIPLLAPLVPQSAGTADGTSHMETPAACRRSRDAGEWGVRSPRPR